MFLWLGVDFRHYYAQALALRAADMDALYTREGSLRYGQALAVYSAYPDRELEPTLVPYELWARERKPITSEVSPAVSTERVPVAEGR